MTIEQDDQAKRANAMRILDSLDDSGRPMPELARYKLPPMNQEKPGTFEEKRELFRTAARSILAHRDAGRFVSEESVKWAEQLLKANPQPTKAP